MIRTGAVVAAAGIALFIGLVWKTVGGPPVRIDVPGPLTKERPELVRPEDGGG